MQSGAGCIEPTPYTISDGNGGTDSSSFAVTVSSVNDAPRLQTDTGTVSEDGSVSIDVLANDADIDGTLDPSSVQIVGTAGAGDPLMVPGEGTWTVNTTNGRITFTPEPDYAGPVTDISYTVRDSLGATSNPDTISVSITAVNDNPVGAADTGTVIEDGSVAIDVLANDTDIDGTLDPTTVQIVGTASAGDPLTVPGEGTWTVNTTNGQITFIPVADYDGPVSDIAYTVQDNLGATSTPITVSASITVVNDAPVAVPIPDGSTNEDSSLNPIDVLSFLSDIEGDTVTITGASALNGTVTVNGDGSLNYIPDPDYNGTDTISFSFEDGNGGFNTSSVDVVVAPVNDAPDAGAPPLATTDEDTSVTNIDVLVHASDIDGDTLSVTSASATNGTVTINGDGTLNYVPNANYNGLDTIFYTVDDGNGGTDSSSKFIFINAINDAPVATNDSASVNEDSSVTINVLGNDTDLDGTLVPATVHITGTAAAGDPLTVPGEGLWSVNTTTGEITFTPEASYSGSVTDITYTVEDSSGATSNPATVSVSLSAVNDPPVIDLSDSQDIIVNGSFSNGSGTNWNGWNESGDFDGGGAGANAPAFTTHDEDAVARITQTGLSGLSDGPGAHGAALVTFDFGWSDHHHESEDISVTLRVAGTDYARITTTDGEGGNANIVYLNGASGPPTSIPSSDEYSWVYYPIEVNLPASVSDTGDISITFRNEHEDDEDHTDEGSIDNVRVFINDSNTADVDNQIHYTAGDPPTGLLDSSSTITDVDGSTLQSASNSLNNAESGDRLLVNGAVANNGSSGTVNGLSWVSSISGVTVQISITGSGTHADYLSALQQIEFENTNSNPVSSVRTIDISVNDGIDDSSVAQAFVLVGVDSSPPTVFDDTASGTEDTPLVINVLANDSIGDDPIDPTTVQLQDTANPGDSLIVPGEGTWSVNTTTGEITFTGEPNYFGTPTPVEYSVSDINGLGSALAHVDVTIAPVNDVPVAADDGDTVLEDGSVTIDVLANDTDVDGTFNPATVQIAGTASAGDSLVVPGEGTWSVNTSNGRITFTPEADYDGPVNDITYTVRDNQGALSNPANLSVAISPVNDAPTAGADSGTVIEDNSVNIDVLVNDGDIDGTVDPTTVQIVGTASAGDPFTVPGQGTWSVNAVNRQITFTPEPDYDGAVTAISYTVRDNDGTPSAPASVSVSITPVNDTPIANGDSDTVVEDGSVSIDVLANDNDLDGTLVPASVQIVGTASAGDPLTVPGEGTWSVNTTNGRITFTPEADYNGPVTDITYTVDDNLGATSNPATVSVSITAVNDVPVAGADFGTVTEDSSVTIDVLANDSDLDGTLVPASVQIVGTASAGDPLAVPGEGTWTVNTANGRITFTPEPDYGGLVSDISYTVQDNLGATSTAAAVSVSISPVNDNPTASGDSGTALEDGSIAIDVLANDSDIDGTLNPASVQIVGTAAAGDPLAVPGEGTWTVNSSNGRITFTPEPDYDGPVTDISYTVQDNLGAPSGAVTVSVSITPVNDDPVASGDSDTVFEDSFVAIDVLANDTDIDGTLDPASVQIVGTASAGDPLAVPGEGIWSVNTTNGNIIFTPEADYTGAVTNILYTVQDDMGATSSPVAVSVSITPVNDPATDLQITGGSGLKTEIPFGTVVATASAADEAGDTNTYSLTNDAGGLFAIDPDTGVVSVAQTGTASFNEMSGGSDPFNGMNFGDWSAPTFADIDNDGDFDLFVGNGSDGDTLYSENTGSDTNPIFAAAVANPFGLTGIGNDATPTFVDIDDDGDLDAFIGDDNGDTNYFQNTGSANAPAFAAPVTNPFGLSQTGGSYAAPTFVDIDGDGDLDAFVGDVNGDIEYFRNTGSASSPNFASAITNPFGLSGISASAKLVFADIDGDGDMDAFIGDDDGEVYLFENTGSETVPSFAGPVTSPMGLTDVGIESAPSLVDLDGDGDLDFVVGDSSGDLTYFQNSSSAIDTSVVSSHTVTIEAEDTAANTYSEDLQLQFGTPGGDTITGSANTDIVYGYDGADTIDGQAGDDVLYGDDGNDDITGGAGDDTINSGAGNNDRVYYSGNRADYTVHDNLDGTYTVTDNRPGSPDGTDLISSTEFLAFADQSANMASAVTATSPIAFDLSGDGEINVTGETTARDKSDIDAVGRTVQFDMDGNDDLETIEWMEGTGDALLVDNSDGQVAQDMNGTRLFGDQGGRYEHGYQQLSEFDTNKDGTITRQEGEGLNLWIDDGNAQVDENELFSLEDMGVSEINLDLDENARDEEGRDLFRSTATLEDGTEIVTEDVWFAQVTDPEDDKVTRPDLTTIQNPDDFAA